MVSKTWSIDEGCKLTDAESEKLPDVDMDISLRLKNGILRRVL